jgi:GNAT superfamily N-acetyltransferase
VESARAARPADLDAVLGLAAAMRQELRPMRGGRIWALREARPEPLADAYRALLERDDALVVVGTIDEAVVGFGTGEVEVLQDGSLLGVVNDLFVDEEARAVGVGEAMLGVLSDFFIAQRCLGIDALALPGHRATKNFFEESGLSARAIVMHRVLGQADEE